jgi:hypothetical protein
LKNLEVSWRAFDCACGFCDALMVEVGLSKLQLKTSIELHVLLFSFVISESDKVQLTLMSQNVDIIYGLWLSEIH